MKVLGILGGIGPESTGHLYLELIKRFQKEFQPKDNTDYPHILINSVPAQDLIKTISEDILSEYKEALRALERWGAEVIIIACNGAYCFFEALQGAVTVPVINVRDAVEKTLRDSHAKDVLVLASPTTIKHGLYQFSFVNQIALTDTEMQSLGEAIAAYNLGHKQKPSQKRIIERALKAANSQQTVIAGCTEIHAMLNAAGIEHINPMSSLIDAIFAEWQTPVFSSKQKSPIHGDGIFSTENITAGTSFYTIPQAHISNTPVKHWAHFQGVWYDDPTLLNSVNHSCEPNIEIASENGQIVLRALRTITPGEELTCDYDKTEMGGNPVPCSCKTTTCRKTFLRID